MIGGEAAFPSWSQQINTTKRFTVLAAFGGAAVLDNETGPVWERTPSTGVGRWSNRLERCYTLEVGGCKGWGGPTIEELASLVDTSQPVATLPPPLILLLVCSRSTIGRLLPPQKFPVGRGS